MEFNSTSYVINMIWDNNTHHKKKRIQTGCINREWEGREGEKKNGRRIQWLLMSRIAHYCDDATWPREHIHTSILPSATCTIDARCPSPSKALPINLLCYVISLFYAIFFPTCFCLFFLFSTAFVFDQSQPVLCVMIACYVLTCGFFCLALKTQSSSSVL